MPPSAAQLLPVAKLMPCSTASDAAAPVTTAACTYCSAIGQGAVRCGVRAAYRQRSWPGNRRGYASQSI